MADEQELGVICTLHDGCCNSVGLEIIPTIPLTKDEATDYILAKLQAHHYEGRGTEAPCIYWIPLSSFHPVEKSKATPLTPEMVNIAGAWEPVTDDDEEG